MDLESEAKEDTMETLLEYKNLARNASNNPDLAKDKKMLHFLAYSLYNTEDKILEESLDVLELLAVNNQNKCFIIRTFGVVQAIDYLAANDTVNNAIRERARKLAEIIRTIDDQSKNKDKATNRKILTLQVFGLHEKTKKELEDILMKRVKGIYSVMVDVDHQRCTVTAFDTLDPKSIDGALKEWTNMEARLVIKNKLNQEVLVALTDDSEKIDIKEMPPYLEDTEPPVHEKAVRSIKDIRIVASEWFSVAAGIWQQSRYW